jgi:hypothetical protein
LTQGVTHTEAQSEHSALEMAVRLINLLVAIGTLTEAEATEVYDHTLASISDPAQRAATLRILESLDVRCGPHSAF